MLAKHTLCNKLFRPVVQTAPFVLLGMYGGHTMGPSDEPSPDAEDAIPNILARRAAHSRRYPLLTPGQEIELAKRIERSDLVAKELMINSNLRLILYSVRRYRN